MSSTTLYASRYQTTAVEDRISKPSSPARLKFIEGMRAVAALYVALGHIANIVDPSFLMGIDSHAPLWLQNLLAPFHYGHLAVAAFIVISGFCLRWAAIQRKDPDAKKFGAFLIRRFKRILPPYYACLLISTLVAIYITPIPGKPPYSIYLPVTEPNLLAHLFLVQNLNSAWMYKINGVLWSIAIEFQIYFVFRILGLSLKTMGKVLTLALIGSLVWLALSKIDGIKFYPWYVGLFAVGMIAADFSRYRQVRSRMGGLILWASLAVAAYGIVHHWNLFGTDVPVGIATACALFIGGRRGTKSMIVRVFSWRPLAFVGAFSYSFYLMHDPVLQSLSIFHPWWVKDQTTMLIYLALIALPISMLFSLLFALVFEGQYVRRAIRDVFRARKSVA